MKGTDNLKKEETYSRIYRETGGDIDLHVVYIYIDAVTYIVGANSGSRIEVMDTIHDEVLDTVRTLFEMNRNDEK